MLKKFTFLCFVFLMFVPCSFADEPIKIYITSENFPDTRFRNYVTDKFWSKTQKKDDQYAYLDSWDIADAKEIKIAGQMNDGGIDEELGVSYSAMIPAVKDFKGVEYFTELVSFDCPFNSVDILDLSGKPNLLYVNCENSRINSINLSGDESIEILNLKQNNLRKLDLSGLFYLENLNCSYNKNLKSINLEDATRLTNLDFSVTALEEIDLTACIETLATLTCVGKVNNSGSKLKKLDLNGQINLVNLSLDYNPDLQSIDLYGADNLKSITCSNSKLQKLDVSQNFKLNKLICSHNELNELTLNDKLTYLDCSWNQLESLTLTPKLVYLDLSHNKLKELKLNEELEWLDYTGNDIISIDFSRSGRLRRVRGSDNPIPLINLIPDVEYLDCSGNELTSLDVSRNHKLRTLICGYNNLTTSNLKLNDELTYLDCSGIKGLVPPLAHPNLQTLICNANGLKNLNVSGNEKLIYLSCQSQNDGTTRLTLTLNPGLQTLHCEDNKMSHISLNENLERLYCDNNEFKKINLNPKLKFLSCTHNNLTSLKLNSELTDLYCNYNKLGKIELNSKIQNVVCNYNEAPQFVGGYKTLNTLQCEHNSKLVNLDLSKYSKLQTVWCRYNQLASLLISSSVENLYCSDNAFSKISSLGDGSELKYFDCSNNKNLEHINLKSTKNIVDLICNNCPNLKDLDIGSCYPAIKALRCDEQLNVILPQGITEIFYNVYLPSFDVKAGAVLTPEEKEAAETKIKEMYEEKGIEIVPGSLTVTPLDTRVFESWELIEGSLPDGLELISADIKGTPTLAGQFKFKAKVLQRRIGSNGPWTQKGTRTFTIIIKNRYDIKLNEIVYFNKYKDKRPGYEFPESTKKSTWKIEPVSPDRLPKGIKIKATGLNVELSGKPEEIGNFYFKVIMRNAPVVKKKVIVEPELTAEKIYWLPIRDAEPELKGFPSSKLPDGTIGKKYRKTYSFKHVLYEAELSYEGFPQGVKVYVDKNAKGSYYRLRIEGTPEVWDDFETVTAVKNSFWGFSHERAFKIKDVKPKIDTAKIANPILNQEYYAEIKTSKGIPLSWSFEGIPTGLSATISADKKTAIISGVASEAGKFKLVVNAGNTSGTVKKNYTLTIKDTNSKSKTVSKPGTSSAFSFDRNSWADEYEYYDGYLMRLAQNKINDLTAVDTRSSSENVITVDGKNYLIIAELPELIADSSGQYDILIELDENKNYSGKKLFWFANPIDHEISDDDYIADFYDGESNEEIYNVPENNLIIVSGWLNSGVSYEPLILVEVDAE